MATRYISQETFDDAVRENVEEFDMSKEEAVKDAVEQFKEQGVDLSHIVTKERNDGDEAEDRVGHHVAAILGECKKLSGSSDSFDGDLVISELQSLDQTCTASRGGDKDDGTKIQHLLPHQIKAGRLGVVACIVRMLKSASTFKRIQLMKAAMNTLSMICTKCPPNLALFAKFGEGAKVLSGLLRKHADDASVQRAGMVLVRAVCTKHPGNTDALVKEGLLNHFLNMLNVHGKTPSVVVPTALAMYPVAYGDGSMDSKSPEYAKYLAENEGVKRLIEAIRQGSARNAGAGTDDEAVVCSCCKALEVVAVNDKFCQEAADVGGPKLLVEIMSRHALAKDGNDKIVSRTASCLSCLARSDRNKSPIGVDLGGCDVAIRAMASRSVGVASSSSSAKVEGDDDGKAGKDDATLARTCIQTTKLLTAVTLRQPEVCVKVVNLDGHVAAINAMRRFPASVGVQRGVCLFLRNLVSRNKNHCKPILEAGAETLIRRARASHERCEDVAFAALRDLGCDISDMKHYRNTAKAMYGMYTQDGGGFH